MDRMDVRAAELTVGNEEYFVLSVALRSERRVHALSAAEREVAALILKGYSNEQIAEARRTSIRTVANQVGSAMRKLAVGSRVQLASMLALHPFEVCP